MITVSSNIGAVAASLTARLKEFQGSIKDKVLRTVAVDQLAKVRVRIHQEGKNADDAPIGEYSSAYLKYRQRKPFNNTSSSTIIFSLTRKMQNEFVVIPTEKGYGLGWLAQPRTEPNAESEKKIKKQSKTKKPLTNFEISQFLEERFGSVWSLTNGEKAAIKPAADRAVREELVRLRLL